MEDPKTDQKLKIRLKYTKPETKRILTLLQPSSSANFNQEQELIIESDLEEGEIRETHESKLEDLTINQQKDHQIEDKKRICGFCNKVFANGKALGGHLRIHKKKEKDGPDDLSPKPGPEKEVICKYCHKKFRTEKALYGHMRSHPERPHRGMGPPPPLIWKRKGKRSRPIGERVSTSSSSFSSGPGRAESLADCLMKMSSNDEDGEDSNNHDYYDELMKKIRVSKEGLEKFDDDELYYLQEELGVKISYKSCVLKTSMNFDDFPKIGKENKKRKLGHGDDHGDDDDDDDHDEDDDDEKKGKWVCTTCNKSFATHQALGGHRSSHNKEKNSVHVKIPNSNSIQTLNLTRIVENGYGYGSNRTHVKEVEEVVSHKCKICDQNFPSGQALGGHMRLHYVVPCLGSVSGSGSGSGLGQSSSQTGQGVRGTILDFDLNVAAVAEDVNVAVDSSYL